MTTVSPVLTIRMGMPLVAAADEPTVVESATAIEITESLPFAEFAGRSWANLQDSATERWNWPSRDSCQAIAFLFIAADCPISNAYAAEISRIADKFQPLGVTICVVYAAAGLTADQARSHAAEYGYRCPAIWDPEFELAIATGATVVPEAVVVVPSGQIVYRGRIDDRYVAWGKRREQLRHTELRNALHQVLAGETVTTPRAPAIGCDIVRPPAKP